MKRLICFTVAALLCFISINSDAFYKHGSNAYVPPPLSGNLRTVAVQNGVPNNQTTQNSYQYQVVRWPMVIGSGDVAQIVVSFNNWYMSAAGDINIADSLVVDRAALEIGSTYVPVTFSGSATTTLAPGASDVQSDAILPSSFSLSTFTRGTTVWVRAQVHLTGTSHKMPANFATQTSNFSGSIAGWFDPVNTTINNVYGTGAIAVTGNSLFQFSVGYCPILLGLYASGDPATFGSVGDSIISGQGGTSGQSDSSGTGGIYGYSFFVRAMHNFAGTSSTAISALSASSPGQTYDSIQGTNTKSYAFYKYAKYWVDAMGSNDFGSAPTSGSQTAILVKANRAWANIRSNALLGQTKILRLGLLARTLSTDTFATEANQTINTGWGSGGPVELFNTGMAAQVTAGNIDAYFRSTSWQGVNTYKWLTNNVARETVVDGLHPSSMGHSLIGQDLYTILISGSYP